MNMTVHMDSVDIWNQRYRNFENSVHSSGRACSPNCAHLRHLQEKRRIFKAIPINKSMVVLDIGAGGGRWSTEFSKKVRKVYAIEPSDSFKILQANTSLCKNIECDHVDFYRFHSEQKYDIILISGLLMYILDNSRCEMFLNKASTMLRNCGYLVLREPVSRSTIYKYGGTRHGYYSVRKIGNFVYFDISRKKKVYEDVCEQLGMKLVKVFAGPVTLFEGRMIFNRYSIQEMLIRLLSRRRYRLWYFYNDLFGRIEELVRYTFNMPAIKILIFKKGDNEVTC